MSWPNIQDVLRYYGAEVPPPRSGWTKMRCFQHPDRTPSAAFHVSYNSFNCMSCGLKGDAIGLVMELEGMRYPEAKGFAERVFGESDDSLPEEPAPSGGFSARSGYRPGGSDGLPAGGRRRTLFGEP